MDHEYSIVGHSRSSIGRYLTLVAALLASAFVTIGAMWSQLANHFGLPPWADYLAPPVSGGVIYVALHYCFNRWGWSYVFRVIGLPNIGGKWQCSGVTLADDGAIEHQWTADVSIAQTWEKIRVNLRTPQSSSKSVSAALVPDGDRWMLMYSYRNEPRIGEQINPHLGYCELSFATDFSSAEGDYFTARGRGTRGRMTLQKV